MSVTVQLQDQFDNVVTSGLDKDKDVTLNTTGSATGGGLVDIVNGVGTKTISDQLAETVNLSLTDTQGTTFDVGSVQDVIFAHGAATKLQILLPGETAAPGTLAGKSGTALAQTAGTPFTVTVNAVDATWNLVNTVTDTVRITSSDVNAILPFDAALVAGTQAFSVTLKTGGTRTVTASDITDPAKTANTSSPITVNAGAVTKLQILLPGETAAPGTGSGKTGSPTAQTAGTAIATVRVNAVDADWNVVNTANPHVTITSSDANAVIANDNGVTAGNLSLVAGTGTLSSFTFKTAGTRTVTATYAAAALTANTSASVTVNPGAFVKLQLLAPGETAASGTGSGKTGSPTAQTAGTAFSVTVNAVDANWNLVSSAPANTIGITTTDPNDTHPVNAALASGTRTFSVTFKTVGSWTVTATNITDGAKISNTSPPITVSPGAVTKLQILLPGEVAAPGTATGKTAATPTAQTAGTAITNGIVVNAVDANWNIVPSAVPNVTISSTDTNAISADDNGVTAGNLTLVAGTGTLSSFTFKTAGTRTVTATDAAAALTANTSASVTVNAA